MLHPGGGWGGVGWGEATGGGRQGGQPRKQDGSLSAAWRDGCGSIAQRAAQQGRPGRVCRQAGVAGALPMHTGALPVHATASGHRLCLLSHLPLMIWKGLLSRRKTSSLMVKLLAVAAAAGTAGAAVATTVRAARAATIAASTTSDRLMDAYATNEREGSKDPFR